MLSRLEGGQGMGGKRKAICLICVMMFAAAPQISLAAADFLEASGTERSYLARTVYRKLAEDRAVSVSGLQVEERDGEIILRGNVPDISARRFVERNIRHVTGVRRVVNLLLVAADSLPAPAGELKQRVERALAANPYVPGDRVSVTVSGGDVVLQGTVRSAFEREQAEKAAQNVSGVNGVRNLITVEESWLKRGLAGPDPGSDVPQFHIRPDSLQPDTGASPAVAVCLDAQAQAGWIQSINTDSLRVLRSMRRGNPETGCYEAFNFLGLGVFLAWKVVEWIKD